MAFNLTLQTKKKEVVDYIDQLNKRILSYRKEADELWEDGKKYEASDLHDYASRLAKERNALQDFLKEFGQ